jgi:hypothetical protein
MSRDIIGRILGYMEGVPGHPGVSTIYLEDYQEAAVMWNFFLKEEAVEKVMGVANGFILKVKGLDGHIGIAGAFFRDRNPKSVPQARMTLYYSSDPNTLDAIRSRVRQDMKQFADWIELLVQCSIEF